MIKYIVLYIALIHTANSSANEVDLPSSVSLSPHITELIYSAGAGESILGVSAYSNFPESVKSKQIIGDAFHLNLELITQLDPDFVFYWDDGTPKQTVEQLKSMKLNLIPVEIKQLSDIPKAIRLIAHTLNTKPQKATDEFLTDLNHLKNKKQKPRSALIQFSDQPIFTVNGSHWMSEAIEVCGLSNVFADLEALSAAVTLESVVLNKPEVIIRLEPLQKENQLSTWSSIPAIKNNHVAVLEADHFTRPTLRTMRAIESLCEQVEQF
ncbi:MAG: helical backbone metal receptor [Marinicella sp.]